MENKDNVSQNSQKPELILGVVKPIWLAMTGPMEEPLMEEPLMEEPLMEEPLMEEPLMEEPEPSKIIGWTTIKPRYDNGFIDKGTVLVFSNIYSPPDDEEEGLNFIIVRPGPEYVAATAEFFQKEIDTLTREGALTLLSLENIDEISIMFGEAFIKYPTYISFDAKVLSPRELYVIMGPEESKLSNNRIKVGEKMSLKRLLEVYSAAVGQNLVLK